MSPLDKAFIAANERQKQDYEIWQQRQMLSGALGSFGQTANQAATLGCYDSSQMATAQCAQEKASPEAREVHQATRDLDFALQRLSDAVVQLNHRTSDVQRIDPEVPVADCAVQRALPSAAVAQVIAKAAIMILDQVEKLEAMDHRIQL